MSYARFGWDGSDVYVFGGGRALECCGCHLSKYEEYQDENFVGSYFMTDDGEYDYVGMIEHLKLHRQCGDVVPDDCFEDLAIEGNLSLEDLGVKPMSEADRQRASDKEPQLFKDLKGQLK